MNTEEQKALSTFVTKKVNEGETIENSLMRFYKSVRFAQSEDQAKEILKNTNTTLYGNKIIDFKVNDQIVTVVSYSLINQGYVYVININQNKNTNTMELNEYYKLLRDQPTPQKDFREKIAKACGVSEMTVYRWLSGEIIPEKLKREKIAEITGLPVEELFPNLPTNE